MSDPDIYRRLAALEKWRDDMASVELPKRERAGTYTPLVQGSTTPGTYTPNVQVGFYTRNDTEVVASGYVDWTGHTGTGSLTITLPYAAIAATNYRAVASVWGQGFAFTGAHLQALLIASGSVITFSGLAVAGTRTNVTIPASGIVLFSIAYQAP